MKPTAHRALQPTDDEPWQGSQRRMFLRLAWLGALACALALWVQRFAFDPLDRVALPLLALTLLALQAAVAARRLRVHTAVGVTYAATTVYFLLALEQQFRTFTPQMHMLSESTYWFALLYAAPFLLYPPRQALRWAGGTYAVALGLCLYHLGFGAGRGDLRLTAAILQFLLAGAVMVVVQATFGVQRMHLLAAREAAYRDALTGLANRRAAEERLAALSAGGEPFTVVLFDLDHFKRLNDEHGHATGDRVLRGVAGAARGILPPGGLAARWGGEEFLLILPPQEGDEVRRLLDTLRGHLRGQRHGEVSGVTACFGVATTGPGEHPDSVIHRADAAMYAAKRQGRNDVRLDETHRVHG
ncbi:GGDEF domain-containing protein [Deinococcus planocerae]|uniref:GGDEF domain-containing protein n=1 Tax=Deinococcus planocerae TaxID=1737569 RepID=UPI000C7F5B8E|nr:GGDEF domain-containing protein [Deinococcus planocerae]